MLSRVLVQLGMGWDGMGNVYGEDLDINLMSDDDDDDDDDAYL